jgi:hypothetical protein
LIEVLARLFEKDLIKLRQIEIGACGIFLVHLAHAELLGKPTNPLLC